MAARADLLVGSFLFARYLPEPAGGLYSRVVRDAADSGQRVWIGLGSNVGDRAGHIEAGMAALGRLPGTRLAARSALIETEPMGLVGQERFLNAAAEIVTRLEPSDLLRRLHMIERSRGRNRDSGVRWGPRQLDLDILLIGPGVEIATAELIVPHPRLTERAFVLEPLSGIAPALYLPELGATVTELLGRLSTGVTAHRPAR